MTNEFPDKVTDSFRQLKAAATQLNTVSDELGKSITALDEKIKRLNLGISTWVEIEGGEDDMDYWSRDIGYARVGGKWGIALRTVAGNHNFPEPEECAEWLFSDAPRELRVKAVDKLPDLLEALTKKAIATADKIKDKIGQAQNVVAAIAEAAKPEASAQPRK